MTASQLRSSRRSITIATVANILDADAIKTSIATVAAAVTYSGADLNGAAVDASHIAYPNPDGHTDVPQYPIAVASSSAGSYVDGSLITFTGTYGGEAATSVATVVGTDGNATFKGASPLDSVSSVSAEAQANTSGAFTFGFDDIGAWRENGEIHAAREIIGGSTAGNISVLDEDGHADVFGIVESQAVPLEIHHLVRATTTATFTLLR